MVINKYGIMRIDEEDEDITEETISLLDSEA